MLMDPIAISQNLTCQIEKMMGIFPNISKDFAKNIWDEIPCIEIYLEDSET